jgi:DNA-binding XRE family transcriptional regulator
MKASILDVLGSQSIFDRFGGINRFWQNGVMITPPQCRAARGLLDWTQQTLADRAGVGIVTVRQFEGAENQPRRATLDVIQRALESAGIEFIDENGGGAGVRLRKAQQQGKRK